MASIFPDPRSKLIFLINNYDMLLGVISLNKKHDDASNSVYRFDSALRAVEAEFVGKTSEIEILSVFQPFLGQAVKPFLGAMKTSISDMEQVRMTS